MMAHMRLYAWMLLLCSFGMQTVGAAELARDSQGAVTVINAFHAVLLSTMKHAKSLGYKGRYTRLEPTIRQSYDFPEVGANRGREILA